MSNRPSSRTAAGVVALAAAIAVAGCGGSTQEAGNGAPAATPANSTAQAASPTSSTATHTKPAKSESGPLQSAQEAAPATVQHAAGTQRRFLMLGNAVCRTVRIGAPAPVRPDARAAQVSAYAKAALPAAQRTAVSLQRIGARAGHEFAFDQVTRDFDLLSSLYLQAAGRARRGHVLLSSINSAERRASSDARRSGLAACAPDPAPS